MPFNCSIIEVKTNLARVNSLIDRAYTVLNEELPDSNKNCGYCKWVTEVEQTY